MDISELLQQARDGEAGATAQNACVGQLLQKYRSYLELLARLEIGRRLQGKIDASDIVQEVFLDAHKHFPQFRGDCEPQFVHWLRSILAGKLSNHMRHYFGTQARAADRERSLEVDLNHSTHVLDRGLVADGTSPSQQAARREQGVILAEALDRLPPDYKEVLVLRHLEELAFQQVAERMNRSVDSVQKLWVRALAKVRLIMQDE